MRAPAAAAVAEQWTCSRCWRWLSRRSGCPVGACAPAEGLASVGQLPQLQFARPVLDERRAIFHPIAGVAITYAAAFSIGRAVDVSADDPVQPAAQSRVRGGFLEAAHISHGIADL